MLAAALDYAERGWTVFPLRGKQPLTANGFHDATDDTGQIATWWRRWPGANIGAPVPKTLIVVDVDLHGGGFDTLSKFPDLPETLTTRTGGGGLHLWFLHPGGQLRQGAGILGPGIDTRAPGKGYVVLPPSMHKSGRRYEWADPDRDVAMLPNWITGRLRPPAPKPRPDWAARSDSGSRLDGLCRTVATAPEGQRNHVLNWAAYRARDLPDQSAVVAALTEAARAAGLEDREIAATIRSGLGVAV